MKKGIFDNFLDDFEVDLSPKEEPDCYEILHQFRVEENLDLVGEDINEVPEFLQEEPAFTPEMNIEPPNPLP